MSVRSKVLLALIMMLGHFLIGTSATSADIFDEVTTDATFDMTTLELAQRHTANATVQSQMFNTFQIQPQGYDVGAIRIRKEGETDFQYRFKSLSTSGSQALCDALEIEVQYDRNPEYNGLLKNMAIDKTINADEQDDWLMFIELNDDSTALHNQQCNFQLVFKTWGDGPDDTTGFWDEAIMTNTVTTGTW